MFFLGLSEGRQGLGDTTSGQRDLARPRKKAPQEKEVAAGGWPFQHHRDAPWPFNPEHGCQCKQGVVGLGRKERSDRKHAVATIKEKERKEQTKETTKRKEGERGRKGHKHRAASIPQTGR